MLSRVQIIADSTCDLPPELLERYNIAIIPLYITLNTATYLDKIDIQPADIFAYVAEHGALPKTAAVSVQDYVDRFTAIRANGAEVVHINIGAGFSSCYQNACLAAQQVSGVFPVDSQNLSSGMGLLVLKAAELAEAGLSAQEIAQALHALAPKVESSFVIDSLDYLNKGGRCSTLAALGANLLSLKPCIEVRDGEMKVGKKYRGALKRCLKEYVQDRFQDRTDIDTSRLMLTHTMPTHDFAKDLAEEVSSLITFDESICSFAGCTISCHCGPGTLGVLFIRK